MLSVELIDPSRGEVVASDTEDASGRDEVLATIRRISGWLRETLGESLAEIRPGEKLERISVLEGEIALASEDRGRAIRLLREGLAVPSIDGGIPPYFMGTESLEEVLRSQGHIQEALDVLVRASRLKISSAFFGPAFAFWMRNQQRLARKNRGQSPKSPTPGQHSSRPVTH